jgi:hypothetical protein
MMSNLMNINCLPSSAHVHRVASICCGTQGPFVGLLKDMTPMTTRIRHNFLLPVTALALSIVSACAPTIKIEAPDKPIVINLNVKIDQEIRIRLDKEVEAMISSNPGIF